MKVKAESVSTGVEVTFDPEEYVTSFKPDMMEVLYAWSKGAKFREICKMTDHFEVRYMLHCFHPVLKVLSLLIFKGSIIRVIRRLEELLRQLASAAHSIGNNDLKDKFNEGSKSIKRDIVFAASLYL